MMIINLILSIFVVVVLTLTVFLTLQLLLGMYFFSRTRSTKNLEIPRPSATILIPAHNEELVIANTLKSVLSQTQDKDRVVVVVDNCEDNTKSICEQFDVDVVVRKNEDNKSKGFALDFGLEYIKGTATDCIIIVDADCILEENALEILSKSAIKHERPIQSLYLIKNAADSNTSIGQKISEFAFLIKNKLRPAGMKMIGLPCHLMGTGMAFPWQQLMGMNLANSDLVEDMKLGVDFVKSGSGPFYEPSAIVSSYFPTDEKAINSQRERWEHGHVSILLRFTPPLLRTAFKKLSFIPLIFSIDLMIPPLALLVITFGIASLLSAIYVFSANSTVLLWWLSCTGICFTFAIFASWATHGSHIIKLSEMLSIPRYIASKLGMYKKLFGKTEKAWIKTKR